MEEQAVPAGAPGGIGGEVGVVDSRSAALAGGVGPGAQALEGPVDTIQHLRRLRQFGFVPLFHGGQSTAGRPASVSFGVAEAVAGGI
jgi:hypothetical protein